MASISPQIGLDREHNLVINCKVMKARLTPTGCEMNQDQAAKAYDLLVKGIPIASIDEAQLIKLVACSRCDICVRGFNHGFIIEAIKAEWVGLVNEIDAYMAREDTANIRESQVKAQKRYRDKQKVQGKEDERARRDEAKEAALEEVKGIVK